jgi:hypothetical protein
MVQLGCAHHILDCRMFKKNLEHLQCGLFGLQNSLPEASRKCLYQSEEYHFYRIMFCTIKETLFAHLYSDKKSRPNAPINAMVAALILMNRYCWTYEELFKNIRFNILTRIALGIDNLDEMPFCPATLFNFQNRFNDYFVRTGINLLEQVFDQLTDKQLKTLKLKTTIQRTDSFMAASNIRNYSRLQLLIELIIRLYRILSDEDKQRFQEQFAPYVKKTSGQYIYSLKASDVPHELQKIAQLYLWIYQRVRPSYRDRDIMQTFERVLREHFTVEDQTIQVKSPAQLKSDSVQSPDDLDATYRDKNGKTSKGQSITIAETAHPDNPINLLNDIAVEPNNKDESKILSKRIDEIKRKTPDIDELHFDGAFGSSDNDVKFQRHGITAIQTGIRGPTPAVDMEIEQLSENQYAVSCPHQKVTSTPTRKRFKAQFDVSVCKACPLQSECASLARKKHRVYYFAREDYLRKKRVKSINTIAPERRTLRNNVEATINEFVCKMPKGKVKVRGAFKTAVFAYTVGISVNFGRIYRFILDSPEYAVRFFLYFFNFFKEQVRFFTKLFLNIGKRTIKSHINKKKHHIFVSCC